jgi:hypothetical protein
MGKLAVMAGLVAMVVIMPASAAPKASFGACKTKIMQDSRNLDGPGRNYCGRGCMAKVRACMSGAG